MNNTFKNNQARSKYLISGLGIIALIGIIVLIGNVSENSQTNTTSSTPSPQAQKPIPQVDVSPGGTDAQIEGQIAVKFKSEYTDAQIAERLKVYHARVIKKIDGINWLVVSVPTGRENSTIEALKKDPAIESAEGDYATHALFIPNDPLIGNQYYLDNVGQVFNNVTGIPGADVKAKTAWDVTRGAGVKVAIIDTGIDFKHPEFAGKIVASKSFTTPTAEDIAGHGTHVAGTIAARGNNGVGISGVCPECQLIIAKVLPDSGTGGTSTDAVAGITWSADQGAQVINMSLGTPSINSAQLYQEAINYALSKGAIVVAASGNCGGTNFAANGCPTQNHAGYPGSAEGVITVGATDNQDQIAAFSNTGSYVEVTAPGKDIFSSGPTYAFTRQPADYNSASPYYITSGTSMSAPVVSGVVALIIASPRGTGGPTAVINRLYDTSDKISGTGTFWTKGRVNAAKAVGAFDNLVPSPVCVGGSGVPPCATIPVSTPTIPVAAVSPTLTEVSPVPSTGTIDQQPTPETTPGIGGAVQTQPCPAINEVAYTQQTSDSDVQPLHNKKHRKHHSSGGGFLGRFFSGLFDFIFKFIELILKIVGIGNPCLIQGGTTTPVIPVPTSGINPIPTISQDVTPTIDPNAIGVTLAPNDITPTPPTAGITLAPTIQTNQVVCTDSNKQVIGGICRVPIVGCAVDGYDPVNANKCLRCVSSTMELTSEGLCASKTIPATCNKLPAGNICNPNELGADCCSGTCGAINFNSSILNTCK